MLSIFGEEYILERDSCPIHYWLAGSENKPVLLFTHGAQVDHTMFQEQIAFLSQDYRIITWDMRGHGLSQPLAGELSYRAAAQDIVALLDAVGVEQAVLIGHSMGGCAAQEVAFMFPERVMALILIGTPCVTKPCAHSVKSYGRFLLMISRLLPEKALVSFMQGSAKSYSVNPKVQTYIRETTNQLSKQTFGAIARALLNGYHDEPDYVVKRPFLLTHGDQDSAVIQEQAPHWAKREPNCQYTIIPDAGHNANQDNAKFFNETLQEFLLSTVCLPT